MTAKSAAAHERDQEITMRYIRILQDAWKKHSADPWQNDFDEVVEVLISKSPKNKKNIIAAERFVRTGE